MRQKGFAPILILLVVIGLAILVYFRFIYKSPSPSLVQESNSPVQTETSSVTIEPTPKPTTDPTVNWETYSDKKWKFSVRYPAEFFTACYPEQGLKLWGPNFDCQGPHDIFYTISAIGYEDKDYKPYKEASKTEKVVVAGRNATKNTYIFDETDGPLFGLHEETEIVIPLQSGLIQLVLLGQEGKDKVFFDQILSTFKFTQ